MHNDHTKVLLSGTCQEPGNVPLESTVSHRTIRGMGGRGTFSEHTEPDILVSTGKPSPGKGEAIFIYVVCLRQSRGHETSHLNKYIQNSLCPSVLKRCWGFLLVGDICLRKANVYLLGNEPPSPPQSVVHMHPTSYLQTCH